jgi:hypothetical protein
MSDKNIPWTKDSITPHMLHIHLSKALSEVIKGEGFLPDSHMPNETVKKYLQQAVLFGDKGCLDALVANLRNAIFNYHNMEEL